MKVDSGEIISQPMGKMMQVRRNRQPDKRFAAEF